MPEEPASGSAKRIPIEAWLIAAVICAAFVGALLA
jgi:hypothetical protein